MRFIALFLLATASIFGQTESTSFAYVTDGDNGDRIRINLGDPASRHFPNLLTFNPSPDDPDSPQYPVVACRYGMAATNKAVFEFGNDVTLELVRCVFTQAGSIHSEFRVRRWFSDVERARQFRDNLERAYKESYWRVPVELGDTIYSIDLYVSRRSDQAFVRVENGTYRVVRPGESVIRANGSYWEFRSPIFPLELDEWTAQATEYPGPGNPIVVPSYID